MSSSTELGINDVFSTAPGVYFRYLGPGEGEDQARVIELTSERAMWQGDWSLSELASKLSTGVFSRRDIQGLSISYVEPESRDMKGRDRRWGWIEKLIADPLLWCRKGRKALFEKYAAEVGTSPETLMKCVRLYFQGGQTKDALLTNEWAKGSQKSSSKSDDKSLAVENKATVRRSNGRRKDEGTESERAPYPFFGEERERIRREAKSIYIEQKLVTRRRLYRALMMRFYSYQNSNGEIRLFSPDRRPTPKQVNYAVNQLLSATEILTRNTSAAEHRNNTKAKTGSYMQRAVGVGDVYEIDSTIVDLWLVARDNRNKIIGKATLYLIVDRFSRLIVGFHLSLDKPSWATAMEALTTVSTDKRALSEKWGGKYDAAVWPADKVMCTRLAADRGPEFMGFDSDSISEGLRVAFENMPAKASALKGMVEMTFKLINVSLKDDTAGYEAPAHAQKRQRDKAYERDACMTLDELGAELLDIIRLHNLRMHKNMRLDNELVLGETRPIPVEVWSEDAKRRTGQLRRYDENYLRMRLLPQKKAVIQQQGIYVNKCHYTCKQALDEDWFVKARNNRRPLKVTYDRRLVDAIYIHGVAREPVIAELAGRSTEMRGLSVAEVYSIETVREVSRRAADEYNLALEVEHEQRIRERAARAAQQTREAIAIAGGASRTSGSKSLRDDEAAARRAEEATLNKFALYGAPTPPRNPISPNPAASKSEALKIATLPPPQPQLEVADPLDALFNLSDD